MILEQINDLEFNLILGFQKIRRKKRGGHDCYKHVILRNILIL